MNGQQRIGVFSALAGAALMLGAMISPMRAQATGDNNVTTCAAVGAPSGSTQFDGSTSNGTHTQPLFTYLISSHKYVTLSNVSSTITISKVVVKGGDGYNVYSTLQSNMRAPNNGGGNVPDISHWFLCYKVTTPPTTTSTTTTTTTTTSTTSTTSTTTTTVPEDKKIHICHRDQGKPEWKQIEISMSALPAHLAHQWGEDIYPVPEGGCPTEETTTTVEQTTTTVEQTTTTVEQTTTTAAVTTTTVKDKEKETTTTAVAQEAPTPTVTTAPSVVTTAVLADSGALPTTGSSVNTGLMALALALLGSGLALVVLARRPAAE